MIPLLKEMTLLARIKGLNSIESSEEVAEFLIKENCKGTPDDGESCPLANYLSRGLDIQEVEVFGDTAVVDGVSYSLSEILNFFMEDFDSGAFPELVQ